jgi:hypothetical protein
MSELDVIVAALAAGAAAGTTNTATAAVKDAYDGLKSLLRTRLGAREESELLSAEQDDEDWWRRRLGAALTDSGALTDDRVALYARAVLEAANPATGGIIIDRSQGVQAGIHLHQTNYFGGDGAAPAGDRPGR